MSKFAGLAKGTELVASQQRQQGVTAIKHIQSGKCQQDERAGNKPVGETF